MAGALSELRPAESLDESCAGLCLRPDALNERGCALDRGAHAMIRIPTQPLISDLEFQISDQSAFLSVAAERVANRQLAEQLLLQ